MNGRAGAATRRLSRDTIMKWLAFVLTTIVVLIMVAEIRRPGVPVALPPDEQCLANIAQTGREVIRFADESKFGIGWPGYYVASTVAKKPVHCPSGSCYWYNREIAGREETSPRSKVVLYCEVDDNDQPIFLHDGKMNVCFCDGHVEKVTPAQYRGLCWR